MSAYTIGEIAGWMVIAALLGFALGWLARELRLRTSDDPRSGADRTVRVEPAPAVVAGPHPGSALPMPDGSAPSPDYDVKVSRSSKIYHAPSSPAWARTTAAIWFVSPEAAEDAGFRKPKNG